MNDEFYKAKWDYECQRDFIFHVQDIQRRKNELEEREKDKVEEAAMFEETMKNLPHPYAKEMDICQHLLSRVHYLKRAVGLEEDSESAAKRLQQEELAAASK